LQKYGYVLIKLQTDKCCIYCCTIAYYYCWE